MKQKQLSLFKRFLKSFSNLNPHSLFLVKIIKVGYSIKWRVCMEQRKNVYKMFVNGKWVDARSNEKIEVLNPATGEAVAEIPRANSQDVHAAIEAAFYAKDTSKRSEEHTSELQSQSNLV